MGQFVTGVFLRPGHETRYLRRQRSRLGSGPYPERSLRTHENREQQPRRKSVSAALDACRDKLHGQLERDASPDALRGPIREFATLARRLDIPPERVLAMIKRVLSGVPAFERRDGGERADLTARFAQIAIQAYYSEGDKKRAD